MSRIGTREMRLLSISGFCSLIGVLFSLPTTSGDLTNDAVFANTYLEGLEANFEGDADVAVGEGITFYSYYPASAGAKTYANGTIGLDVPSEQVPVLHTENGYSFDPKADLLIAKPATCTIWEDPDSDKNFAFSDADMFFARLTGVLRIELNAASSTAFAGEAVKSFRVDVSSGDIAGRVVVDPVTGELGGVNSLSGCKSITATYNVETCPVILGAESCNNVILSVAPVTIPAGSTMTFTIVTANATTGAEAHTLVKTVSGTPKAIAFESSKPTVIKLALTDDNISNNTIEYELVKSATDLVVGSEVIIASSDKDFALGTTQASNNRPGVSQSKEDNGQKIVGPSETVQLLSIVAGNQDNTIAFYTGDGYLCAASSGSNYLRTESELTDNSSWSVSIDSETGVASIVAQGSYTRNTMQYNVSSNLFACYSSASQGAIAIYMRSTPDTRTPVTLSFGTSSYELGIGTNDYTSFTGQTVTTDPAGVTGVKYALTGAAIGSIDEDTGAITLNGTTVGEATITASFAGNTTYKPATPVSYTITVDDPRCVTLDWTYPESGDATLAGLNATPGVTTSGLGTYAAGNAPYLIKMDSDDDNIVVKTDVAIAEVSVGYKMIGGNATSTLNILESSDGETFTSVEDLTISGIQNSEGIVTTSEAFLSSSRYVKINFTKGANIGIGSISIMKVDTTPRFTVESPLEATAAADDYTVNITRKYFTGAITVTVPQDCDWIEAENVAANATSFEVSVSANTGAARSATLSLSADGVTSQQLVVNQAGVQPGTEANPYTVAQALAFIETLGDATSSTVWVTGTVSKVESFSSKYKSITYFISDDGTNTNTLEVYSGNGLNGANFTDITDLAVGDKLVVKGTLQKYNNTPEFTNSSIITSIISQAPRYTVTLGSVTPANSGTIAASATSVGAQGEVTLTATPASGYELDEWTVTNLTTNQTISVSEDGKFIMPASNVSVSANFAEAGDEIEETITGTFTKDDSGNLVLTTNSGITITQAKGNGTAPNESYSTATSLRVYVGNTLSFTGKTITKIVFTHTGSYNGGSATTSNVGTYTRGNTSSTWEGEASSVVITNAKGTESNNIQLRPTKIVVTYKNN